jgi:hypothetical protein
VRQGAINAGADAYIRGNTPNVYTFSSDTAVHPAIHSLMSSWVACVNLVCAIFCFVCLRQILQISCKIKQNAVTDPKSLSVSVWICLLSQAVQLLQAGVGCGRAAATLRHQRRQAQAAALLRLLLAAH